MCSELSNMTPCSRHFCTDRAQLMAPALHLRSSISHVCFRTTYKTSRLRTVKCPVHEGEASKHIIGAKLRVTDNKKVLSGVFMQTYCN